MLRISSCSEILVSPQFETRADSDDTGETFATVDSDVVKGSHALL